jgi:hypothetical protein
VAADIKHMTMQKKIKVAQFGLGPIGIEALKLAASKPWVEIVGGVDIAPDKVGKDLAELTGDASLRGRKVYETIDALVAAARPEVVLHTSVSKFAAAAAQIDPIVRHGISVVSSSEELLCPTFRDPILAAKLDALCQQHGARVLGTGVNPGFVMDVLPVVMTGVSRSVRSIAAQRVVNATTRRGPLQRKICSGWTPEEFEQRFKEGKAGHAGLKDSVALIAHCLGWKVEQITEAGRAMVADHDITTPHVQVKRGQCCGLHQIGTAVVNGRTVISLDLKMYLDAPNPHDAIQIEGEPPLNLVVQGGVAGDHATVAAVVNAVPRVLAARPGLRLMTDIAVPCLA